MTETRKARGLSKILKLLKGKNKTKHNHRTQYPNRLIFRNKEIMSFSGKQKLREIYCQWTSLIKNVKRSSSDRRKIIQFRNLDLHKVMKSIKAGMNEGKTYLIFLILN